MIPQQKSLPLNSTFNNLKPQQNGKQNPRKNRKYY
jgi:hypothetical protein